MGRWSELRSSPTVQSVQFDQALLIAVASGVPWLPVPLFLHVAVPSLRVLAFLRESRLLSIRRAILRFGARPTVGSGL